jgi:hypothetical protein
MGVQPINVPPSLALVLNTAGDRSGVDFDYLLQTAIRESSLNPTAKAQTSSATGLFQFIESTWLEVMKDEGPRLGYQKYADAITTDGDGDLVIKDKQLREEVLELREEPQIAADLAAAFTRKNGAYLYERFGRMPSPGELYIAHFMGARGAAAFFEAGLADPDQVAAKLFPKQAKANPTIFYELGKARTIKDVYRALVSKHEGGSLAAVDATFAAQQLASGGQPTAASGPTSAPVQPLAFAGPPSKWPNSQALPSRFTPDDMAFTTLFSTEGTMAPQPLVATGSDVLSVTGGEIKPRTLLSPDLPPAKSLFSGFTAR